MSRGTRATLRLDALRHNLGVVRAAAPQSRIMAVVKANAYGHGIEPVVRTLEGADGFAVATLGEAQRVRAANGDHRVLLLEGITSALELDAVVEQGLDLVVHSDFQLDLIERHPVPPGGFRLWLKIDTGMHRLGFPQGRAAEVFARIRGMDNVSSEVVLTSHLANADAPGDDKTARQIERFQDLYAGLNAREGSLANSAGVFGWPDSHYHWVRVGIGLYGETPLSQGSAESLGLQPCMTLRSTLIAINACRKGDSVGYGSVFRCPEDMPVGVVAIGYGDGYPRRAPDGTPVLVKGERCPLVGRVSMDMLTVDLRRVPDATVGDEVVLWGDGLPVAEVAAAAETIPYELMCGVTSRVETELV